MSATDCMAFSGVATPRTTSSNAVPRSVEYCALYGWLESDFAFGLFRAFSHASKCGIALYAGSDSSEVFYGRLPSARVKSVIGLSPTM